MATKAALIGEPNSGKSYGGHTLPGEQVLTLQPSKKDPCLFKEDGSIVDPLTIYSDKVKDPEAFAKALKIADRKGVERGWNGKGSATVHSIAAITRLANQGKDVPMIHNGNYLHVDDFTKLPFILRYVNIFMPHIKIIILADFTHYLSNYVKRDEFVGKAGKAAGYDKFTEMAVKALDTFFSGVMDSLRDDLIIFTEFHLEDREDKKKVKGNIFVPAGNMLNDWFKPESYFDIMLGTMVLPAHEEPEIKERYKYVTNRISDDYRYCRSMGMFENDLIPNDLNLVVNTIRERQKDRNYTYKLDV